MCKNLKIKMIRFKKENNDEKRSIRSLFGLCVTLVLLRYRAY
jgi:hypothetical protein